MDDQEKLSQNQSEKKSTRLRPSIYGKRQAMTFRIHSVLRDRMMSLCDELNISANTYITDLIQKDLTVRKK